MGCAARQIAAQDNRRYRTIAEAAERMSAHNKRLTPEQALHLASQGVRRNADGTYSWKFDEYQKARAPYRLLPDDHIALWSRITCPTLLLRGSESFLRDPESAGVLAHFRQVQLVTIAGAGCPSSNDLEQVPQFGSGALHAISFSEIGGSQRRMKSRLYKPSSETVQVKKAI